MKATQLKVGDTVYFACPKGNCKIAHSSKIVNIEGDKVEIYVPKPSPEEMDYNPNYSPHRSIFDKSEVFKEAKDIKFAS